MNSFTVKELLNGKYECLISCNDNSWRELILYLLGNLNEWLGYEVNAEPLESASVGEGFCIKIVHASLYKDDMLYWKGILGATVFQDRLWVSLTVFMYSYNEKLVTKGGKEFIELSYVMENGDWQWKSDGWQNDTYGEFPNY